MILGSIILLLLRVMLAAICIAAVWFIARWSLGSGKGCA